LDEKPKKRAKKPKRFVDHGVVAWTMHRIKGVTAKQIAEELGIHISSVKNWVKKIDEQINFKQEVVEQQGRLYAMIDDAFSSMAIHVNPRNAANKDLSNFPASKLILSASGKVVERKNVQVGADHDLLKAIQTNRAKAADVFGELPGGVEDGPT